MTSMNDNAISSELKGMTHFGGSSCFRYVNFCCFTTFEAGDSFEGPR
jgi:hypothetical protein